MIIRCPQCEFTRSISESKIPATAELATCPKCKSRFRFRTLERGAELQDDAAQPKPGGGLAREPAFGRYGGSSEYEPEKRVGQDIWDTMDILNQRWEKQTEDTSIVARAQDEIRREERSREGAAEPDSQPIDDSGPSAMDLLAGRIPAFRTPEEKTALGASSEAGPDAVLEGVASSDDVPRQTLRSADLSKEGPREVEAQASFSCPQNQLLATPAPVSDGPGREGQSPDPAAQPSAREDSPGPAAQSVHSRPAFLYDDGDITPELRVERDLLMLKGDPGRPSRDLGRLDDAPFSGQAAQKLESPVAVLGGRSVQDPGSREQGVPPACPCPPAAEIFPLPDRDAGQAPDLPISPVPCSASLGDGDEERIPLDIPEENMVEIPWENPRSHGWFSGFTATVQKAMFSAPSFFSGLDPRGSLTSGYLFFLLQGYVAIVFSLLWRQAAAKLIGLDFAASGTHLMLLVLLLLAPFALGLVQVFLAGCIRVLAHILYPYEYPYNLVFKTVSYAAAPLVVSVVPFVGPFVGVTWFLVSLVLGCRYSLRLSWTASFLIPTPPALIVVALIAFFYI